MNGQICRSVELLFEGSVRALDVKFFSYPGVTAEILAEQVIRGFASLEDESSEITDVDQGLTASA